MADTWFYQSPAGLVGPISTAELRAHALAGKLRAYSFLRHGEQTSWQAANRCEDLAADPAVQQAWAGAPAPPTAKSDDPLAFLAKERPRHAHTHGGHHHGHGHGHAQHHHHEKPLVPPKVAALIAVVTLLSVVLLAVVMRAPSKPKQGQSEEQVAAEKARKSEIDSVLAERKTFVNDLLATWKARHQEVLAEVQRLASSPPADADPDAARTTKRLAVVQQQNRVYAVMADMRAEVGQLNDLTQHYFPDRRFRELRATLEAELDRAKAFAGSLPELTGP